MGGVYPRTSSQSPACPDLVGVTSHQSQFAGHEAENYYFNLWILAE
jgi:hypothetical protein